MRTVLSMTVGCVLLTGAVRAAESPLPETVRFNRDIRPILSDACFACHGPDAKHREAKLRFDVKDGGALKPRRHGAAIAPGDPAKSQVIARILSSDPDDVMPPPETNKKLTARQVALLKKWIEQGAPWEGHWVYEPVKADAMPKIAVAAHPIDRFVERRLKSRGFEKVGPADKVTLIRRLSFDLTGLPPTPEEVDAFVNDASANAREKLVDRLLASPRFGERMAMYWLDLVRYADTIGYHSDNPRDVYLYRQWVIDAFNANMPYDRFTVEQLAGDLLPDPTVDQKIASGYNRLLQTTEEGGAQAKEYVAIYAADRVRNVSGVWMGATMGCAQCHDHKYDPYTMQDFYSMAAFFADIQEKAVGKRNPGMMVPEPQQAEQLAKLNQTLDDLKKTLATLTPELEEAMAAWQADREKSPAPELGPWHSAGPFKAGSPGEAFKKDFGPEKGVDLKASYPQGDKSLSWKKRPKWEDGKVQTLRGDNSATYLYRTITAEKDVPLRLSLGSDDTISVWLNGESVLSKEVYRGVAPDQEKITLQLKAGENHLLMKICNGSGGYGFYFKAEGGTAPEIVKLLNKPADERSAEDKKTLTEHFLSITPLLAPARDALAKTEKQKEDLEKQIPRTLVSEAGAPREVRILARGNWQDDSGPLVKPAVPAFLGELETGDRRANRLDLARWLTRPDNPLTARTFVNRLWKLYFGAGLARVVDDLGSQGVPPTHPDLLDWLAGEFVRGGWDVKRLVRLMVTSEAYRRDSRPTPELRDRDPLNHWLARQSRFRLDAEMVRDNALAVSGLLVEQIGGPSVKPYQPAGYWQHLNFPRRKYAADPGESQYRRGLYTHWQRSFLHPSLLAFDAPSREECTAERPRSNTPLQALVLLNDPTYVEAARTLAQRVMRDKPQDAERLHRAFRLAVSREPQAAEQKRLMQLLTAERDRLKADPASADALLAVGRHPVPDGINRAELAAWTGVARVLLNLHETITRN